MIDWNGDHIGFVLTAYVIVAVVLAIVVAMTLQRAATLKKTLAEMKLPDTGQQDKA
jgi:heme exporter protein CcmD